MVFRMIFVLFEVVLLLQPCYLGAYSSAASTGFLRLPSLCFDVNRALLPRRFSWILCLTLLSSAPVNSVDFLSDRHKNNHPELIKKKEVPS